LLSVVTVLSAKAASFGDSSRISVLCAELNVTGDIECRPPYKTYRGNFNYYPMKIGDCVHIGNNTIVEAATIGNHVDIGKNCIIVRGFVRLNVIAKLTLSQGKFAIIKDCAKIADFTVIPPNTVVPALALFSGSPGTYPTII
jgi:dynactin 5